MAQNLIMLALGDTVKYVLKHDFEEERRKIPCKVIELRNSTLQFYEAQ